MGNCCPSPSSGLPVAPPERQPAVVATGKASDPLSSTQTKSFASETSNVASLQAAPAPKDVEELRQTAGNQNVKIFMYDELRQTTGNFRPDQILGKGGFGLVYKGVIDEDVRPGFESTLVAVKEHDPEGFQGDKEWLAEVNYLGQLSHPNLVKLIGYCCEDDHRLLVYEYMARGSLEKHLFRRVKSTGVCVTMSWPIRMKAALGAARGLAFLHGAERQIIYRDFKTSNILLDADYNAKLSDFGLAKEGPKGDKTHVSTRVMGTYGYAAPEYLMTGHLTAMSDVYAFGVVLLEMLLGKRATDKNRPGREFNLVEWGRPILIRTSKLMKIIDPRMNGQYSGKEVQKVAHLAYQCLSETPKGRPTMEVVVSILEPFDNPPESVVAAYKAENEREAKAREKKRARKPPDPDGTSMSSEPPAEHVQQQHHAPPTQKPGINPPSSSSSQRWDS